MLIELKIYVKGVPQTVETFKDINDFIEYIRGFLTTHDLMEVLYGKKCFIHIAVEVHDEPVIID